jgi:RNA polymerase sigma factor (sigma-70 family)
VDDATLLAAFVRDKSEEAFKELVKRHVGMVYSVCYRQLRDTHWAEDVTQAVFILLARKAANLQSGVVLGGWLYRSAVFACSNARDLKRTRSYHEKLVKPMRITTEPDLVERAELEGLLDEGLMELNKAQREVLVLRFFENKPLTEVARIRGQSLYATQKALDSGMARLRRFMAQRGVVATTAILAAVLIGQAAKAAPAGLATAAATAALGGGTTALSVYVSQLVAHMLKQAARAKLIGSLAVAGTFVFLGAVGLYAGAKALEKPEPAPMVGAAVEAALTPAQRSQEIDALWGTLRQAEGALRSMNVAALSDVVAFTDPQQAANWDVMSRVFVADFNLKRVATAKFGPAGRDLTAIETFGRRLDTTLPTIDPASLQWDVNPRQAALHFGYRDPKMAGGTIYFAKDAGRWRIDAAQSLDVSLEGIKMTTGGEKGVAAMENLNAAERELVLDKMKRLELALGMAAQRIDSGELADLAAVQKELKDVDSQSAGRAFFWLGLQFDSGEQIRRGLAKSGFGMGVQQ